MTRTIRLLCATAIVVLLVCGCSKRGASPAARPTPRGAQAVTIDAPGGSMPGDLYGPTSRRGIVVISSGAAGEWTPLALELGQLGYRVLVYTPPAGRGGADTARAAAGLLRRRGVESVVYVATGVGATAALEAAGGDAAGVALLNPAAPPEPLPSGAAPAVPVLALASLADAASTALARRIYDAAAEPRTLALYPARTVAPAVFAAPETAEVKSVFFDFLRDAFEPLSA